MKSTDNAGLLPVTHIRMTIWICYVNVDRNGASSEILLFVLTFSNLMISGLQNDAVDYAQAIW